MAWLWWLLAPVCSTCVGAVLLAARARREQRQDGRPLQAMQQHRRLIDALAESGVQRGLPAAVLALPETMVVLDPAAPATE
ncbi:MAG TPA: hypothetical protein VHO01_07510 [Jatrophihabitans sp.]|nr:hypothetical protein [Jatrophihabitans sp.]